MDGDPLYPNTYAQTGEQLGGISAKTVQRIVRRGQIAVTIIGGKPRILQKHIEAYLERQTREAVSP